MSSVRLLAACGIALFSASPLVAQAPRDLVARAATAMGGEAALRAVTSTSVAFTLANFALGQEETPGSPARVNFFTGTGVNDFARERRVIRQEARPVPTFTIRVGVIVAGDAGVSENNGSLAPANAEQIATAQRGMRLQPERLILAALDAPGSLRPIAPRSLRGESSPGVRFVGRDTVSIYFDRFTGLPLVTEIATDDPVLGDRVTQTMYTRWAPASGVKFPRQIDATVNGRPLSITAITSLSVNGALADSLFAIPDSISARAARGAAPARAIVLTGLAPHVWRVDGSHQSIVVEQPARLVLLEAPTNAAHMRALLDTLRSRFPGKPVSSVVMSHHHWDHSGGIREAIASGIPVVAHRRSSAFVRGIAAARRTISPDALTRRPRAATVQEVTDSLTIGSGDSRVILYDLPTTHSGDMIAAYLPASALLFVVDVLSPDGGSLPAAASREVVAMVRAAGIVVERVVGGHAGIAAWGDVERAARP